MRGGKTLPGSKCRSKDTHPLGLPSLCGILIDTAFSNVDWRTSSVALKARLLTTSVLLAGPDAADKKQTLMRQCKAETDQPP